MAGLNRLSLGRIEGANRSPADARLGLIEFNAEETLRLTETVLAGNGAETGGSGIKLADTSRVDLERRSIRKKTWTLH